MKNHRNEFSFPFFFFGFHENLFVLPDPDIYGQIMNM